MVTHSNRVKSYQEVDKNNYLILNNMKTNKSPIWVDFMQIKTVIFYRKPYG